MVEILDDLHIPEAELVLRASRSSGPGGQHVNKVSSRVTLHFDVEESPTLTAWQKRRIRQRLATRVSRAGVLRVVCQRHRSQAANRREVVERFAALLRDALRPVASRVPTRVPPGEQRRRLEQKRRRAQLKRARRRPDEEG